MTDTETPDNDPYADPEAEVYGFPEHGNDGNDVETERTATPDDFPPAEYEGETE